jgi:hypothetical protein
MLLQHATPLFLHCTMALVKGWGISSLHIHMLCTVTWPQVMMLNKETQHYLEMTIEYVLPAIIPVRLVIWTVNKCNVMYQYSVISKVAHENSACSDPSILRSESVNSCNEVHDVTGNFQFKPSHDRVPTEAAFGGSSINAHKNEFPQRCMYQSLSNVVHHRLILWNNPRAMC